MDAADLLDAVRAFDPGSETHPLDEGELATGDQARETPVAPAPPSQPEPVLDPETEPEPVLESQSVVESAPEAESEPPSEAPRDLASEPTQDEPPTASAPAQGAPLVEAPERVAAAPEPKPSGRQGPSKQGRAFQAPTRKRKHIGGT